MWLGETFGRDPFALAAHLGAVTSTLRLASGIANVYFRHPGSMQQGAYTVAEQTGEPWAELWFGAHPMAPARVGPEGEPLDRLIAADPEAALGAGLAARFGRLPFLVKVLAAESPLSL